LAKGRKVKVGRELWLRLCRIGVLGWADYGLMWKRRKKLRNPMVGGEVVDVVENSGSV
jgi:hypothetical protein